MHKHLLVVTCTILLLFACSTLIQMHVLELKLGLGNSSLPVQKSKKVKIALLLLLTIKFITYQPQTQVYLNISTNAQKAF